MNPTTRFVLRLCFFFDLAFALIDGLMPGRYFQAASFNDVRVGSMGMHPWGLAFAVVAALMLLPTKRKLFTFAFAFSQALLVGLAISFGHGFIENMHSPQPSSPGVIVLYLMAAGTHYAACRRVRAGG